MIAPNWILTLLLSALLFTVSGCSTIEDTDMLVIPEETETSPETGEVPGSTEEGEEESEVSEEVSEEGEEEPDVPEEESENPKEESETPESLPNLVERASAADSLSLFVEALERADKSIIETLTGEGPYTLFAPTDSAVQQLFVMLGDDYNSFDDFENPVEEQILNEIVLGHVVEGNLASDTFVTGTLPTLLPNDSIELVAETDTFTVRDASEIPAHFVSLDLEASNGTVHIVDKILIPQKILTFVD